MVPNLIWAPDFFGPQEIWSPKNLGCKKFGPWEIWTPHKNHYMAFSCRGQIYRGPKKSGAQMRMGTISAVALFLVRPVLFKGHACYSSTPWRNKCSLSKIRCPFGLCQFLSKTFVLPTTNLELGNDITFFLQNLYRKLNHVTNCFSSELEICGTMRWAGIIKYRFSYSLVKWKVSRLTWQLARLIS